VESELFPALRTLGIRFYVFHPLAGGLLTSNFGNSDGLSKTYVGYNGDAAGREMYLKKSYVRARTELDNTCKTFGVSLQDASLRWLAHHSMLRTTRDDGIILGGSKISHLKDNIQSVRRAGPLPLTLVVAFDAAWEACKIDCPAYFYH